MTSSSDSEEHVLEKSVKSTYQEEDDNDARKRLGTEAIEQLASGLNLAAHTIQEYSQNTIDDENLKQLNDEQLFRLLEEAYHSKKLDEKNKSAIFKEILEDVHESLASTTPDNSNVAKESNKSNNKQSSQVKNKVASYKHAATTYDSIAALTEIMDPAMSSHITIPASGVTSRNQDPDADTSSTKTEVEEMELDQLSDSEDNTAKKLDENGNPQSSAPSGGSVSFSARQLKPLSIYRHNPAFHSQHVSVNQMDEIPSLSPTSLQPSSQIPSTSCSGNGKEDAKTLATKVRRKKKAVKSDESIKAEEIDGYRGGDDLESLLQFIESKPGNGEKSSKSLDSKSCPTSADTAQKSKRSRRTDRKSKRSRTPSITALSSKEKSPDIHSQSQSRASSVACASKTAVPTADPVQVSVALDSVTTVKNSLIVVNNPPTPVNNSNKKTLKKPKKQAGWLVDLSNSEATSKVRLKSKPPTGKLTGNSVPAATETVPTEPEVDSSEEPSSIQDEVLLEDSNTEIEVEHEKIEKPVKLTEVNKEMSPTPPPPPMPSMNNKVQQELCFNYASILKFVKREWNVVTKELSNGSNDIQSKVVYYKAREKI